MKPLQDLLEISHDVFGVSAYKETLEEWLKAAASFRDTGERSVMCIWSRLELNYIWPVSFPSDNGWITKRCSWAKCDAK